MPPGLDAPDLEIVLESLQDFAKQRFSEELLLDHDARDEMPEDLVREMCGPELGIQLLFVPEEYGGMGGGAFDVYRCCEELARVDVGVATALLATFLGSDPIRVGGTPEQRALWLGRIAEDGVLMAYGATEPEAGSDLAALRTTATPVEEDGQVAGYRLNGRKQWISNGGVAEVSTVLANAPGGPTWFVVEAGTEGFGHERPEDKHGIRLSNTAALTLDDVFVPASQRVGEAEGQGLQQAVAVFGFTRLMVAAFGLGAGWAALDRAIAYSLDRVQAGSPLAEKSGYTHKLIVPHVVRLEAGRAFIEETAASLDELEDSKGQLVVEGAIAKYLATEAGVAAADAAIQALGGYGYTREYMVEKIRRDVRITTIYEGTSEIMEMSIARDRWQQHLKTRGAYYHDRAQALEKLEASVSGCGAAAAALACHALAEIFERARLARLTRSQHVLFRLGELVARTEGAGALARRAAGAATNSLSDKADGRFGPEALAAVARSYAREAALEVGVGGLRWVIGGAELSDQEVAEFERALGAHSIHQVQRGALRDLDIIADALYGRTSASQKDLK
ncbi:MAG: acyl-CoA dehydrogenase [bacterium]|nr:acyl-CoA dehydrogenase [bacterium]